MTSAREWGVDSPNDQWCREWPVSVSVFGQTGMHEHRRRSLVLRRTEQDGLTG